MTRFHHCFDGPSLTFTIESNTNIDAATYIIELTGDYADGTTATIGFNLILDPCVITVEPAVD